MKASPLPRWVICSVLFCCHSLMSVYASETTETSIDRLPKQLPIFSQKLSFFLPNDWKLAYTQLEDGMFSAEFLPQTEGLHNWSSMVCIQGFEGMSANIKPEDFLDTMVDTYRDSCNGEVIYERVDDEFINDYQTASAIIGCTRMPNSHLNEFEIDFYEEPQRLSEIGYYTAVSGDKDLYLIHKSLRGTEFNTITAPIEKANYREFMSAVSPFNLN